MKLLVNIMVPAIMRKFDVMIPESLNVRDVTELIVEAITENTNHEYCPSGEEVLCLKRKDMVLDETLCLKQCGIQNGDTLVLI